MMTDLQNRGGGGPDIALDVWVAMQHEGLAVGVERQK